MSKALLLVDVLKDFEHEDGDRLLASFRMSHANLVGALVGARTAEGTDVYVNDGGAEWEPANVVARALKGKARDLVLPLAPEPGEPIFLKPEYSAFSDTPLAHALHELRVKELVLVGTATEMCVFQTAIDALRHGFQVTVLASACASVNPRHEALALDYLREVLGVQIDGRRI